MKTSNNITPNDIFRLTLVRQGEPDEVIDVQPESFARGQVTNSELIELTQERAYEELDRRADLDPARYDVGGWRSSVDVFEDWVWGPPEVEVARESIRNYVHGNHTVWLNSRYADGPRSGSSGWTSSIPTPTAASGSGPHLFNGSGRWGSN